MDAVFLDRDGVINVNRADHVLAWEQFTFLPGALAALHRLHRAGIPVIVVTNQAAVGRGLVDRTTVDYIHAMLREAVEAAGGALLDILYCPHRPGDDCSCRKPQPGMLRAAAERHGLDLRRCAIVGDAWSDVQAGLAVGCTPLMVSTGRGHAEHQAALKAGRNGYHLVADLSAAVDVLLNQVDQPIWSTMTPILESHSTDAELRFG